MKLLVCLAGILLIVSLFSSSLGEENALKTKETSSPDKNISFILEQIKSIEENGITRQEIDGLVCALQEKFGESSVYLNTMCKVLGIGAGILFPPFIPLSPVVIAAPITLLDTTGLQGHWFHGVHVAVFISFVGLPTYIMPPPLFITVGFAGVAIGIVFE
ncbi:MAG: hypothetical protein DRN07_04865 [Thermoplasmata archaeon]|nr:MAG: hypothetical protein DRN07_04865 [Thermoplasmata archaeon]